MKKFVSLLLTVVMFATMLTVFAVPASADRNRTHGGNAAYIGKWADFIVDASTNPMISNDASYYYFIVDVDASSYIVAKYQSLGNGYKKTEVHKEPELFSGLVSTESIPAEVRAMAEKDYPNLSTGSTLSEGSLTIIVGITAAVVFGLGGFFIGKAAGKKKKPAVAEEE